MSEKTYTANRRDVLKQATTLAGLAAIVGVASTQTAKADGGSMSPASVGYVDHPNGTHQCSNCSLYIPGTPATANGLCKAVAGPISPTAWCQIWAPAS
ncbi:MAG: high-potential iron-sulfur protein [Acidocella sp.]|nr:high-potential iron-sulfur protein [Acidocella sp.]